MATYPYFNLIDEHGKITKRKEDFERFLKESNAFSEENFFVVSVMGGQSGGKSTLLNILFETEFPVLQMGQRKATTKGVMISFARNLEKNLIVLDLEGSDSTEKTESESETFSRKSALFALAVSEILIVNIWSHDVG
ncbi:Dynamin-like GTPase that mediates homotypic ER fusion [Bonamia ostreae]|uniref:Dynamin-like GTPase that mediates homotypic ER fusion n=1 Tax=Bonamia ostreae TaxID=126728 RepID=A0ABV2AS03_9EUKA